MQHILEQVRDLQQENSTTTVCMLPCTTKSSAHAAAPVEKWVHVEEGPHYQAHTLHTGQHKPTSVLGLTSYNPYRIARAYLALPVGYDLLVPSVLLVVAQHLQAACQGHQRAVDGNTLPAKRHTNSSSVTSSSRGGLGSK